MNFLQGFYPGDAAASFLIRVLAEITVVTLAAITLSRTLGRHNAAFRHGICICALFCVLVAPVTTFGLERLGWQTFQISLQQERPAMIHVSNNYATPNVLANAEIPFWTYERARGAASLILLVWLGGIAFFCGRFWLGLMKVRRVRRSAKEVQHPNLASAMKYLEGTKATSRTPIKFSAKVNTPVVVGPLRTTVILPERLLGRLDEVQLRSILAHEFAHVRNHDPLIGLIQRVVEAGYWPHPLVHVLNRDLVRAREEVCDNFALQRTTACQYADTLLTVALGVVPMRPTPGVAGLMTRPWRLEERVRGLLDPRRRLTTTMKTRHIAFLGAALGAGIVFIAGAKVVAVPNPPNAQDTLDLYSHFNAKTKSTTVTAKLTKGHAQKDKVYAYTIKDSSGHKLIAKDGVITRIVSTEPKVASVYLVKQSDDAAPKIYRVKSTDASGSTVARVITSQDPYVVTVDGTTVKAVRIEPDLAKADRARVIDATKVRVLRTDKSGDNAGVKVLTIDPTSSQDAAPRIVLSTTGSVQDATKSKTETVVVGSDSKVVADPAVIGDTITAGTTIVAQDGKSVVVDGQNVNNSSDRVYRINSKLSADDKSKTVYVTGKAGSLTLSVDGKVQTLSLPKGDRVFLSNPDDPKPKVLYFKGQASSDSKYNYLTVPSQSKQKSTTVYIDGGHVKIVGDDIKVVYVHPKAKKAAKKKTH